MALLMKVVLIGDSGVGKTNLLSRFARNEFHFDSISTIGVEFTVKAFEIDGQIIRAQFWDTAGQERYRAITSAYYRGACGALLVYDITKRSTFENASRWLKELRDYTGDDILIMLVGNKRDLKDHREVGTDEAKEFCQANRLFFIETSALGDSNVRIAFETIIKHRYFQFAQSRTPLQQQEEAKPQVPSISIENPEPSTEEEPDKRCCS